VAISLQQLIVIIKWLQLNIRGFLMIMTPWKALCVDLIGYYTLKG
jgi:hypothetical protein